MKRAVSIFLCLALLCSFATVFSHAAPAVVFFTAVNDTIRPLNQETMPIYFNGMLYVPYSVFISAGIYGSASVADNQVLMYRAGKSLDFDVKNGTVKTDEAIVFKSVSARLVNGTFYLPVDYVCQYFGLEANVIPYDPASIIRIISGAVINEKTLLGLNKNLLTNYYNEYIGLAPPADPVSPTDNEPANPVTYENVTINLSFYNLAPETTISVLEALSSFGYRGNFFASYDDIAAHPGLFRRIVGSGHAVGIWLESGTYEEYLRASEILYEAAKIRTVFVSSRIAAEDAPITAEDNGVIFCRMSRTVEADTTQTTANITNALPKTPGSRETLLFSCGDAMPDSFMGVLSFLRKNQYIIARISETNYPV